MFCTPELFNLCSDLKAWGLMPSFEVGTIVARGFADVGSEEFLVLPAEKLLSLTAGTVRELPSDHKDFFFWIPTSEECARQCDKFGIKMLTISREAGRRWVVQGEYQGEMLFSEDRSLQSAMLSLLLNLLRRAAKAEAV